jgi:DNA-binding transcriptional LysR family regulator
MPRKHRLDTLQSLRLFTRAVELGSFSAVAREAALTQPTVSKVVAALERQLGVRLMERTTTSLTLTEEGLRFYQRARQLSEDYAEAVADVRGHNREMVGKLAISAPLGLGELRLNALMVAFLAEHPGIEAELMLTDRMVDLVEEGVDAAIRLGGPLPPAAVARHVADSPRLLVAAPFYLERAPDIRHPAEIAAHPYLRFAGLPNSVLEFARGTERIAVTTAGPYRVNSSLSLRQCFLDGVGVGSAPAWLVRDLIDTKQLVHLLPGWTLPSQSLHLIYPTRRYLPFRTRTFLRFMAERVRALPGFVAP